MISWVCCPASSVPKADLSLRLPTDTADSRWLTQMRHWPIAASLGCLHLIMRENVGLFEKSSMCTISSNSNNFTNSTLSVQEAPGVARYHVRPSFPVFCENDRWMTISGVIFSSNQRLLMPWIGPMVPLSRDLAQAQPIGCGGGDDCDAVLHLSCLEPSQLGCVTRTRKIGAFQSSHWSHLALTMSNARVRSH